MFEHVGTANYARFFPKIRDLLGADGLALIHSIGRMNGPAGTSAGPAVHFPGRAHSRSLGVRRHRARGPGLTDLEILRLHYAETLSRWGERFMKSEREGVRFTISGSAACGNSTSPPVSWRSAPACPENFRNSCPTPLSSPCQNDANRDRAIGRMLRRKVQTQSWSPP